jgi:hypothetical protein
MTISFPQRGHSQLHELRVVVRFRFIDHVALTAKHAGLFQHGSYLLSDKYLAVRAQQTMQSRVQGIIEKIKELVGIPAHGGILLNDALEHRLWIAGN